MSKKLWTGNISVEIEMAIWAESKAEALALAKRHARDELENIHDDWSCSVSDHAPSSDLDDALPWGDFGGERERTVAELKEETGQESPFDEQMRTLRELAPKEGASK